MGSTLEAGEADNDLSEIGGRSHEGRAERMRMRVVRAWMLVAASAASAAMAWALPGQATNAGSSAEFEVASVRPVPANQQGYTSISPWGSDLFIARNIQLRLLINLAYDVDDRNIEGLSDKLGSRMFDVEARVSGEQKLSYEQMQPLLRNLLRERFHLAVHRASREEKGYALVVAKGGAKLKTGTSREGTATIVPTGLRGAGITMETLAGMLSRPLGSPVQDRTGLGGGYDVVLEYRTLDADDSSLPSIFTALQEQLGLKVIPAKVPVAILVVDHVDAEPTEQ